MGITIHYNGTVESKHLADITINYVETMAKKAGYETKRYNADGEIAHSIVKNQSGETTQEWDTFYEGSKLEGIPTSESGILVHLETSESFCCGFYLDKRTNKYVWKYFTKTQVFNDKEIPNIRFHGFIINVLMQIKLRFVENLEIRDEGDYFFTEQQRIEGIKYSSESAKTNPIMEKYVAYWKNVKPFSVKTLIESHGQNLDIMNGKGTDLAKEMKSLFGIAVKI